MPPPGPGRKGAEARPQGNRFRLTGFYLQEGCWEAVGCDSWRASLNHEASPCSPHHAIPSLLDHFSALEDPRQSWRVIYPLPEIMLLVLCATLTGMEDFVEIKLVGRAADRLSAPLPALRTRHPIPRTP